MGTNDYGCIFATAGETITASQVCYLSTGFAGLTAGRAYLADADFVHRSTQATLIGVATAGAAAAAPVRLRLLGVQDGFSGLTAGEIQYVSATAGALTTDRPPNALALGVAISATEVSIQVVGGALPSSLPDQCYFGGGLVTWPPGLTALVDRVTISTTATSTSYGSLTQARLALTAAGNSMRVIWAGGDAISVNSSTLDYQDPAIGSTVAAFGNLLIADFYNSASANSTRALWMRGQGGGGYDIQLTEIATKGNSGLFSDLSGPTEYNTASAGNSTHALTGGSQTATYSDDIIVNTYAVPEASQRQFGSLTVGRSRLAAVSTATRVFWCGGYNDSAVQVNTIDSVVIAVEATATDIGDLTRTETGIEGGSNSVRAVIGSGWSGSAYTDILDYFAVSGAASDATDFGDMSSTRGDNGVESTCHGGLQ